jgi:glucose-1-phosphate adenylyltransferase
VHSFCTINESVLLPEVEVGRGAILSRVIVDQGASIPPGLRAGIDPEEDAKRFHVTEKGITLITPAMLGQTARNVH